MSDPAAGDAPGSEPGFAGRLASGIVYHLPTPIAALRTPADPNYRWTANFLATLYAVLGAFALSAVLGVLLAIATATPAASTPRRSGRTRS